MKTTSLVYEALVLLWPWRYIVLPFTCLLSWRLYRFTLMPRMWSNDPKELPYWIPFLGHTVAFFGNSDKLLERGLTYTKRSHEVFAVQLLGKKLYIITNPADVAAAYRDTEALRFDGHLNALLLSFGFNQQALDRAWHKPEPGDWCHIPNNPVNPQQMNFIHLTEDIYKKQLLPGEKMDEMCKHFLAAVNDSLKWQSLDNYLGCSVIPAAGVIQKGCHQKSVSLYALCRFVMVDAAIRAMFGPHLHNIEPDIVNAMMSFNDHAWMVFFRYPDVFGLPITEPRRVIMDAMKAFIGLPEERRSQQSWALKAITEAQKIVGIDLEASASVLLMILWAANSNEYNSSFWVLAHLLYDEPLMSEIKHETEAAWQSGQLDVKYLCANCPRLEAVFYEALRLNGGAMISRVVLKQTTIGSKTLRPGNSILMPSRQLHTNEDVWGDDVRQFNARRFLDKKSLVRHSSFRPFGGGVTYCPGRVLVKEELYGFVAILLHQYDLKLALKDGKRPPFPCLNDTTPALGITGPFTNMDLTVDVALLQS